MKTKFFTLIFLMLSTSIIAQDISEAKKIPTTYDRSSFAVFFLDNSSNSHWDKVRAKIDSIVLSDKFDNNNFKNIILSSSVAGQVGTKSSQEELLKELNKMNAGRELISKWYNRQPDGTMNMELIHQRGRFTATDADFLRAQTSKRGNAALEDFGNRLVNLSYVLVVDLQNVQTMEEAKITNMKGWKANSVGYIFRLDFNEETRNALYDTWIYDDDSEADKTQKRKAFEQIEFPLVPVLQKTVSVTASQMESSSGLRLALKSKSMDQLMQELVQKSYDEIIYQMEMGVEEFKVKTPLFATRPLRAKIGLKEGLKTDYRFFVYEHVYNPKTNQAEPKQRGVIRAGSKSQIIDNRREATGDMGTSKFYQVAGRKLDAGFTLQQQNDFGMELLIGGEVGNTAGLYLRGDIRLSRFVGIKALFVYVEGGGIDSKTYDGEESTFFRYGGGLAKGFQLMRNIELRPYVGAGLDNTTNSMILSGESISSLYVRGGANLALNLKHNIQFVGGIGYYGFIGDVTDSDGNVAGSSWDFYFDKSGPSGMIGVKIMF
jgi:hypothetical protein